MARCLRASEGNLAATELSEDIGIEIKVKSASIPDKETFFNTNQQHKLLPCFEPGQILLSVSQNKALYGTTGTPSKFWASWKEEDKDAQEKILHDLVNTP